MKLLNAAFMLCCLFCLRIGGAYAATPHSVKGVVITQDGTVVQEFTVVVRQQANQPALFMRKRFKSGEFTLDGLTEKKYDLQISSPLFLTSRVSLDFSADARPTSYCIVILHTYRNETRLTPTAAYSVSTKMLQQKIPSAAATAYAKGVELHREGKLDEALIEDGRALRAYPQYIAALSDIGAIFILVNRPEAAMTFLRRAQEGDDCNPIINLNIAAALVEQGDYSGALKLLKKVMRDDPRMAQAQVETARIYYQQKKYEAAEEAVRQAVGIEPSLLDAWLLLAQVSIEQKKLDQAHEALMRIRQTLQNKQATDVIDEQLSKLGG